MAVISFGLCFSMQLAASAPSQIANNSKLLVDLHSCKYQNAEFSILPDVGSNNIFEMQIGKNLAYVSKISSEGEEAKKSLFNGLKLKITFKTNPEADVIAEISASEIDSKPSSEFSSPIKLVETTVHSAHKKINLTKNHSFEIQVGGCFIDFKYE